MATEHMFRRPDWVCHDCGLPWPCPSRRVLLIAEAREMSRTGVLVFLAGCLVQAVEDRPAEPAGELYGRILGWFDS